MLTQTPINIKIRFSGKVVTLENINDRKTILDGVEIYLQERQSDIRAWASIPDGTLSKYMHDRVEIISCQWIDKQ